MPRKRATTTDRLGRERSATRASWGKIATMRSGRYQASYVGPDRQRHTAPSTFTTRTDAQTWLAAQRTLIATGQWTPDAADHHKTTPDPDDAPRLYDYAAQWIDTRTGRDGAPLRPRTVHGYRHLLDKQLRPFHDLPLPQITPRQVRQWYSATSGTGHRTIAARAYRFLASVMATAVDDGIIDRSPCQVRGAGSASTGRRVDPPTATELATIEANMPPLARAAVVLAAWGAVRWGELVELRRRDITWDGDVAVVSISRAVVHVPRQGAVVGPPKSRAGVRVVAMPPQVAPTIREHLDRWTGPGSDDLLFPGKNGGHLHKPWKAWSTARQAAGREDMPWHALRHFGLTRYAQTGATLREVQARAGHSTVAAAMRYQHAAGRDAELAARMVD